MFFPAKRGAVSLSLIWNPTHDTREPISSRELTPSKKLFIREINTWETVERSPTSFFLFSRVQKYEYKPIPRMAISMPMMFLSVKGSCSSVYPKARTRHVFKWPSTWYVTGDVFPITRKVLKFTETEIMHESMMNACRYYSQISGHGIRM